MTINVRDVRSNGVDFEVVSGALRSCGFGVSLIPASPNHSVTCSPGDAPGVFAVTVEGLAPTMFYTVEVVATYEDQLGPALMSGWADITTPASGGHNDDDDHAREVLDNPF